MAGVLEGLLVLDLTRAVAGPFCTMTLGDLGARIIKVEPEEGDETRRWGPPFVATESTYFLGVNRNKESLALNLKEPAGRDAALAIARRADVVIENFRPGVADRLGLGAEALRALNPRLIYVSISGFGQTGPERLRPGYDIIIQALSGLMRVSAEPAGPAVKTGSPIADICTGLFAAQAILAALYRRERTGEGARIELSLLECLLASMAPVTSACLNTGLEPEPMGTGQPNIAPYQVFRCQDGDIVAGAPNERLWLRFCEAMERPDLAADPRFADNGSRVRHRRELAAEIEKTLRLRPLADWQRRFEQAEVPCAAVLGVKEALAAPQLAARGAIIAMQHPELGVVRNVASPMRFEGLATPYHAPPLTGEDNEALLREFLAPG